MTNTTIIFVDNRIVVSKIVGNLDIDLRMKSDYNYFLRVVSYVEQHIIISWRWKE